MTTTSGPADFVFVRHEPTGRLGRLVEQVWYARGRVPYRRERIAPTGSTVAVMVLGDAIVETPDDGAGPALRTDRGFLIGPHDRPVVNEPTGETHAVGVVTTPIGCEAVLGVPPAPLRGRVVELEAAWAPAADLRGRLLAAPDPRAAIDVVVDHLTATAGPLTDLHERCDRAVAMLEEDPTRAVGEVAAAVGVSHAQLGRDLLRVVGMPPRVLARLLRVRRLLAGLDVRSRVPWGDLAAELGWYDQSHLIRDVRRHTGVTPSQYLAAQRSVPPPSDPADGAGFVPER